jgi:hypothetical protein
MVRLDRDDQQISEQLGDELAFLVLHRELGAAVNDCFDELPTRSCQR